MSTTEVILICGLLAWMVFAFALVLLLDVALTRVKAWRIRSRSRARLSRRPEFVQPLG